MMDNLVILTFAEAKQPEYREKKGVGYIEFGDKNDYPNYLLSLYNKSAKHNAIVKGKVNYITGNGWATKEEDVKAEEFIKNANPYESLNDVTRKVSIDIEVFGGAYLEIVWSKIGGQIASICHIDYTKVRSNKDNTQYWIKDWNDRKAEAEVVLGYNKDLREGKQILYIKEYRPGLDTYSFLFGILVEGSLGTRSEIRDGYEVFKNTYVNDKQQYLEGIFNSLAQINGITTELYIKPVEPINFEFSESIISQFAPKEWILEKIGIDPTKYETVTPEPTQALINENLKGMKGREWQNFQRIIRNYNKGNISREQAVQMLKSGYGLDDEAISTWLGDETYEQRFSDEDSVISVFNEYGVSSQDFSVVARRKVFQGDLEAQELAFRDEVIDDTIDKKILDTIAKNKNILPKDIAKALEIKEGDVMDRIQKLVALEILEYNVDTQIPKLLKPLNEILDKPLKTSFLVRYEYTWDYLRTTQADRNKSTSRPFCQKLMSMNKLYTRGEIQSISARLGYDVFALAGGWWTIPDTNIHSPKCRHTWNAVVVVKK